MQQKQIESLKKAIFFVCAAFRMAFALKYNGMPIDFALYEAMAMGEIKRDKPNVHLLINILERINRIGISEFSQPQTAGGRSGSGVEGGVRD
jgi:hypothetical protein